MSNQIVSFPVGERPDTRVNMFAVIVLGLVMNLLIFGFIYLFKGTFIRDLFMGRNELDFERLIFQFMTMYMFSLSIITVWLKRNRLKSEQYGLWEIPLPQDLDMNDESRLVTAYHQISSVPGWNKSIVYSRAAKVLAMWINSRDFQRTIEYARENSEMDFLGSDSSFRANRLFIWAMPLLGFLGTVYGVSYGIGGFADFLTGADISAEDIVDQVGIITQGLAIAFYTTLVGLFAAGISAFPGMSAERREEAFLSSVDELIEERITARMPSAPQETIKSSSVDAMQHSLKQISDALVVPIRDLIVQMNEGFRQLPSPAHYEKIFAGAIAQAGELLNQKYDQFQSRYEERVGKLGDQLAARLSSVGDEFRESVKSLNAELASQSKSVEAQRNRAAEQQLASLQAQLDHIQRLGDQQSARLAEVTDAYSRQVAEAGRQLQATSAALSDAAGKASSASENAFKQLAVHLQGVMDVGRQIDALLKVSKAVEVSLSGIAGNTEFGKLLADLRGHLSASDQLVRQLSKPRQFVFTEGR